MVCHNIVFAYAQLEIEDIEEFALDPADITFAEYTSADCPVHVFERGIIQVLMTRLESVSVSK
jgi:hypothetical protein